MSDTMVTDTQTPRPSRSIPFSRIAFAIALIALLGALAVPATRRFVVGDGLAMIGKDVYKTHYQGDDGFSSIGIKRSPGIPKLLEPATLGDLNAQLTRIVYDTKSELLFDWDLTDTNSHVKQLDQLADRFPNNPAIPAYKLRYLLLRSHYVDDPKDDAEFEGMPPYKVTVDAVKVTDLVATAHAASQLEPNNGYFAAVEAYSLYAQHRETEGLAMLQRAGLCSDWNDHFLELFDGRQWLFPASCRHDALLTFGAADRVTDPIEGRICALGRTVFHKAARAEQHGDYLRGAMMRQAIWRLGHLMCRKGRSFSDELTANTLMSIAARWPGGVKFHIPMESERHSASRAALIYYLRAKSLDAYATEFDYESAGWEELNRNYNEKSDRLQWPRKEINIIHAARRTAAVVGIVLALCFIGATVLRRVTCGKQAHRCSPHLTWAFILTFILSTAYGIAGPFDVQPWMYRLDLSLTPQLALIASLVTVPLVLIASFIRGSRLRRLLRTVLAVPLVFVAAVLTQNSGLGDMWLIDAAAAIVLAFALVPELNLRDYLKCAAVALFGVLAAAILYVTGLGTLFVVQYFSPWLGASSTSVSGWTFVIHIAVVMSAIAVPAAFAAFRARRQNRPELPAISETLSRSLPWAVCVAALAYVGLAVATSVVNDRVYNLLAREAVDEPQVLGEKYGLCRPSYDPPPLSNPRDKGGPPL